MCNRPSPYAERRPLVICDHLNHPWQFHPEQATCVNPEQLVGAVVEQAALDPQSA